MKKLIKKAKRALWSLYLYTVISALAAMFFIINLLSSCYRGIPTDNERIVAIVAFISLAFFVAKMISAKSRYTNLCNHIRSYKACKVAVYLNNINDDDYRSVSESTEDRLFLANEKFFLN